LAFTYPVALVFVYPLVLLKPKNKSRYFFFFDRYVIGGAQKVHIDILNSLSGIYKQVYFTRYSTNDKLKNNFYSIPDTDCKDIHIWCDYLLLRLFTVHYYAFYINRHKNAIVFSSNSTFFYDMLFFLKNNSVKTELLHNFTFGNNGMEFFGLANYKYLDYRVVVDAATKNNITEQYRQYNIPGAYTGKILLIEPGVAVPEKMNKDYALPLKVLYAGRGGVQKRITLLKEIAVRAMRKRLPVEFHFAGTMMDELTDDVKKQSIIHGEISTQQAMYRLYQQCHVVLMTSAYEGFPMLIKEGMANGCVPVVTALDGSKMHLRHKENGALIEQPEDEEYVIESGLAHLEYLAGNAMELQSLSQASYEYARAHFDMVVFTASYRSFLTNQ